MKQTGKSGKVGCREKERVDGLIERLSAEKRQKQRETE